LFLCLIQQTKRQKKSSADADQAERTSERTLAETQEKKRRENRRHLKQIAPVPLHSPFTPKTYRYFFNSSLYSPPYLSALRVFRSSLL
jgi:hypothetical protein